MQPNLCRMTGMLPLTALIALTSLCVNAQTEFKVTEGLWNDEANWSTGVPTTQEARVGSASASPAKATLQAGDVLTAGTLSIGQIAGAMGEVHQTGGTLNLGTNYWRVGYRGVGTYRLESGQLLNAAPMIGTSGGTGTVHICGGEIQGAVKDSNWFHIGSGVGSHGTVVQTGGVFNVRPSAPFILALGDNGGQGFYELSGGSLTNVSTLYVYNGRLTLSNNVSLVCSSSLQLGRAGGTAIVEQRNASCTTPTATKIGTAGTAVYTISGGSLTGGGLEVGCGSGAVGTLNIADEATVSGGYLWVGGAANATGFVYQSSGTMNRGNDNTQIGLGSGAYGAYYLSGGMLTNAASVFVGNGLLSLSGTGKIMLASKNVRIGTTTGTGTLQIIGAHPTFSGIYDFTHNNTGSALDMRFMSDGISTLTVGGNGNLGGTLSLGIQGGVACFQTNAFLFLSVRWPNGDFAVKNTGVFSTSTTAGKYTATLAAASRPAEQAAPLASGQILAFPPVNQGWLAVDVAGFERAYDIDLDVYAPDGTPTAKLDALVDYLGQSGLTVAKRQNAWNVTNIRIAANPETAEAIRYLAWDLATFDPVIGVGGVSVVNPYGTVIVIR